MKSAKRSVSYLDSLIRIKIRNEHLDNLVSISGHGSRQGVLDSQGQLFLGFKDRIQLEGRKLRTHDIINVRRNLLRRIRQGIKCFVYLVTEDLVLDRDDGRQKDIVECLGFDTHIELLHAKAQLSYELINRAADNAEAGLQEAGNRNSACVCERLSFYPSLS